MRFCVEFTASQSDFGKLFVHNSAPTSLEILDEARKDLGDEFNYSRLRQDVSSINRDGKVYLHEEVAKDTGLFQKTNTVTVRVKKDRAFLDQFIYIKYEKIERDDYDYDYENQDEDIIAKFSIDMELLVKAWRAAGFPAEWE